MDDWSFWVMFTPRLNNSPSGFGEAFRQIKVIWNDSSPWAILVSSNTLLREKDVLTFLIPLYSVPAFLELPYHTLLITTSHHEAISSEARQ